MRFRELMEDDGTESSVDLPISPETVVETLKRDCAHFLSRAQGHWLFRGSRHYKEAFAQNVPFKTREKTHADKINTRLSELMKADGFDATRKDCMFVAKDGMDIGGFGGGKVGVIFPIGPYSVTWFNKEEMPRDFQKWVYGSYYDLGGGSIESMARGCIGDTPESAMLDKLEWNTQEEANLLAEFFWKNCKPAYHHGDDVKAAVESRSEIMLKCQSYHVVGYDYWRFNMSEEKKVSLK